MNWESLSIYSFISLSTSPDFPTILSQAATMITVSSMSILIRVDAFVDCWASARSFILL